MCLLLTKGLRMQNSYNFYTQLHTNTVQLINQIKYRRIESLRLMWFFGPYTNIQ